MRIANPLAATAKRRRPATPAALSAALAEKCEPATERCVSEEGVAFDGSADAVDSTTRLTDEELLQRYRVQGDRTAFTEIVERYERELFSYLRRYLGNTALAEDAFQATFLALHLKCGQFEEGAKLRPWLYTIATHQAIDVFRKTWRHPAVSLEGSGRRDEGEPSALIAALASSDVGPVAELQAAERKVWIRDAVGLLPEHLRQVVILAYYQGLKYREIADALHVPVGTVKSRLHAAIHKLHDSWAQSGLSGDD